MRKNLLLVLFVVLCALPLRYKRSSKIRPARINFFNKELQGWPIDCINILVNSITVTSFVMINKLHNRISFYGCFWSWVCISSWVIYGVRDCKLRQLLRYALYPFKTDRKIQDEGSWKTTTFCWHAAWKCWQEVSCEGGVFSEICYIYSLVGCWKSKCKLKKNCLYI